MNDQPVDIVKLMDRLAADGLDALTPAEMEQLEAAMNADPQLAERLADLPADGAGDLPAVPEPDEQAWDRVWDGITAAQRPQRGHWWRWAGGALAAAAAVLLAIGLWPDLSDPQPRPQTGMTLAGADDIEVLELDVAGDVDLAVAGSGSPRWSTRLDPEIEIVEMETFGDNNLLVLAAGADDDIPVVWLVEG